MLVGVSVLVNLGTIATVPPIPFSMPVWLQTVGMAVYCFLLSDMGGL
jgi:hypothetical protein